MRDHELHAASAQPRARRCRLVATLVATIALGGCYNQRHFFEPAALPQGAGARPVQLYLSRAVSVTGQVTDTAHPPATTRISGLITWTSADSIEIEPRDVHGERGWLSVAGAPPIRLAWRDLVRVEQKALSRGRTGVAAVVSTVVLAIVGAFLLLAISDPYGDA